jgi:hypothetical protein
MLTTIGRNRRRGRHSPADQPLTHRTALRSHPLRRHRPATTAERQSSATDEHASTDEHDAYPDRPLSHSPYSDPRVNYWYPKLTRRSQVRSELNWTISEVCVAASFKHNQPVGGARWWRHQRKSEYGEMRESKPRHPFGRSEPTGSADAIHSLSAPEGIRTPNLLIRSQMLYPLSYGRMVFNCRTDAGQQWRRREDLNLRSALRRTTH